MPIPSTQAAQGRESLKGLFGKTQIPPARLAVLRGVLERAGMICSEELRVTHSVPARLVLQHLVNGTAGELLAPQDGHKRVFGRLGASEWKAQFAVCAEHAAAFTIVELMLGGDGSQPALATDRPLTAIETRVIGVFFSAFGKALAAAFATVAQTAVLLEGVSGEIEGVAKQEAIVAARFRLEALGRGSEIVLAIPQAVLVMMGKAFDQSVVKVPVAQPDARWTHTIKSEINRSAVRLSATLEERMGVLGDITKLSVGQVIALDATSKSRLQVECNGERLLWCHLGQSNGFYTLRVDSFVDREQEFMDDILAA